MEDCYLYPVMNIEVCSIEANEQSSMNTEQGKRKAKRAIIAATGLIPFSQGSESRETGGHISPGKVNPTVTWKTVSGVL